MLPGYPGALLVKPTKKRIVSIDIDIDIGLRSILVCVLGTCDHTLCFTDIYVGWPGSVHDARVFRNSPLYQSAEHDLFQGDTHLPGDSAYPLQRCIFIHYIILADFVLGFFVDKSTGNYFLRICYCIYNS